LLDVGFVRSRLTFKLGQLYRWIPLSQVCRPPSRFFALISPRFLFTRPATPHPQDVWLSNPRFDLPFASGVYPYYVSSVFFSFFHQWMIFFSSGRPFSFCGGPMVYRRFVENFWKLAVFFDYSFPFLTFFFFRTPPPSFDSLLLCSSAGASHLHGLKAFPATACFLG